MKNHRRKHGIDKSHAHFIQKDDKQNKPERNLLLHKEKSIGNTVKNFPFLERVQNRAKPNYKKIEGLSYPPFNEKD